MTQASVLLVPLSLGPWYQLFGFLCSSGGKESICNAGDVGSIPGLGRSPGEGKGYPLQYSGLVTKSQTGLSDFPFHFQPSL